MKICIAASRILISAALLVAAGGFVPFALGPTTRFGLGPTMSFRPPGSASWAFIEPASAAPIALVPVERPQLGRATADALPVSIGSAGDFKDYFRIDAACPLDLRGPGSLTFYVRAHADSAGPAPTQVTVTLDGLTGFPPQRWTEAVKVSRVSAYADGRPGALTGGAKISLGIPAGAHAVTVTGSSDAGGAVYAIFYYDGPPAAEAETASPTAPEAEADSPTTPGAASRTPAKSTQDRGPSGPWSLSSDFFMSFIYDDNISRLSDATLDELALGTHPEKYAIEVRDDFIMNPALSAEIGHARLLFGKSTRFRVRYQRWQYARNDVKTNEEINLRARQTIRRYDYLEGSYTYAPDNYVKELADRPPYTSTTVEREYLPFKVTRNTFLATYYWRTRAWLRCRFTGGRTLRFYNRPFLENDLWEWNGTLAADLIYRRLTTRLQYAYATVEARAYDQVGETKENSDNGSDGSYDKDTYLLRFTYAPRTRPYAAGPRPADWPERGVHLLKSLGALADRGLVMSRTSSFEVEFTYSRQFYTSELPLDVDPLHVGRLDETRQVEIIWTSKPVYRKTSIEGGVRYTVRTADAPAGLIGEDDPSEEKDYTGTRYWIAFSTPLR